MYIIPHLRNIDKYKQFCFKQFRFALVHFSSIWRIDRILSGSTSPGQSGPGSDGNQGSTLHSPKLQHYWNLTIRLFNVIFRKIVSRGSYSSVEKQSVYSTGLVSRNNIPHFEAQKSRRTSKCVLITIFRQNVTGSGYCTNKMSACGLLELYSLHVALRGFLTEFHIPPFHIGQLLHCRVRKVVEENSRRLGSCHLMSIT